MWASVYGVGDNVTLDDLAAQLERVEKKMDTRLTKIEEGMDVRFEPLKIRVDHYRDPDNDCTLNVFVDGQQVPDVTIFDVDPGRG